MLKFILRNIVITLITVGPSFECMACDTDSCSHCSPSVFRCKDLIVPGVLIGLGTAGYFIEGFHRVNQQINNNIADLRGSCYMHADDYVQYLPVAVYVGLSACGVKSPNTFKEQVTVVATSYLVMSGITNILKYTFKKERPDTKARNSFPSGHTATAFTGAELIRLEYGERAGVAAYIAAIGVGFFRLYNNRHWFIDVIAGAGIGILSARVGYWMLPHYRRWFHWGEKKNGMVISAIPAYDHFNRHISLNLAVAF